MVYAGFWRRFVAYMIDIVIMLIPSSLFAGAFNDVFFGATFGIITGFLYYPFFESSRLQATPGKALMGLVIQNESTNAPLTFRAATVRFFAKYLSFMTFLIGFLIQVLTRRRQTLHDIISESVVVHQAPLEINYFKAWKEQLQKIVASL
ncbi:MAG: RDD family protein [Bdellovibrionaceae bacterium]|nr:RDD family protein [Bdellovibrio sp.]